MRPPRRPQERAVAADRQHEVEAAGEHPRRLLVLGVVSPAVVRVWTPLLEPRTDRAHGLGRSQAGRSGRRTPQPSTARPRRGRRRAPRDRRASSKCALHVESDERRRAHPHVQRELDVAGGPGKRRGQHVDRREAVLRSWRPRRRGSRRATRPGRGRRPRAHPLSTDLELRLDQQDQIGVARQGQASAGIARRSGMKEVGDHDRGSVRRVLGTQVAHVGPIEDRDALVVSERTQAAMATSTATTCAAPRRSRQSVKPPVDAPRPGRRDRARRSRTVRGRPPASRRRGTRSVAAPPRARAARRHRPGWRACSPTGPRPGPTHRGRSAPGCGWRQGRGARARRQVADAPRRPASGLLAQRTGRALVRGGPLGRRPLAGGLLALLALQLALAAGHPRRGTRRRSSSAAT